MDNNFPQRLYGLDHLRALAIAAVFLFHYFILSHGQPEWLPDVAKFGWTGVDLFFVLSGYLISSGLCAEVRQGRNISFPSFFLKRFFRIVPAFLVTVALYFSFPAFREKESLPPLWKFLTFTQNLGLNLKDYGTFSHAWSLCVEEHFYLLLPLILIVLQRTKRVSKAYWLLILLFLTGMAARMYSYHYLYGPKAGSEDAGMYWYRYLYYPTYNRLDGLLAGVAITGLQQFLPAVWSRISGYGNALIGTGMMLLTAAYFLCADPMTFTASVFGFPLIAAGYGFVVAGAISPTGFLYRWQSKVSGFIATLSYAVYLTHKGVIHITHSLLAGSAINANLLLLISIGACIVAAYVLNRIIERPFMKLRSRITNGE